MPSEKPILFDTENVRAILEGRKSQTRRVIKPQPDLLYGIYGDTIQLYHNRRAEDDRVDIKTDTNISKRQLYGWGRWQDLLTNQIQGLWQEGFRGVVSLSWMPNGGEGIFNCYLMPQRQESNNVSTQASMYGFPRATIQEINAGQAFGWQPREQQALQSKMGNSIRELVRQKATQCTEPQLQQSKLKDNQTGEGTYTLGSPKRHRQQKAYSSSFRDKPAFHIRNMPWFINQRLWVRETFVLENTYEYHEDSLAPKDRPYKLEGDDDFGHYFLIPHYKATEPEPMICDDGEGTHWKPSIFMPRWASRITLEITGIRVERLQEITEVDVKAEGAYFDTEFEGLNQLVNAITPKMGFIGLWDSLNAKKYPWICDPFVWVISFKRLDDKE